MDLTKSYPRSPYEQLGGLCWLPRLIDKARANIAGTLGEYIYNSGGDEGFFEAWAIKQEDFLEAVRQHPDDDQAMLKWFNEHAKQHTADDIKGFNHFAALYGPQNDEHKDFFKSVLDKVAPGRTDITSFYQLLATEEGHPIPAQVG